MAAIEVDQVSRRFRRTWAVRDCSFSVDPGRVAALVGHNGAGKSTLMNMVAGQLRPTSGRVSSGAVRFVAQAKPLYGVMTAGQMLDFGRRFNTRWDQQLATEWLQDFDVPLGRRCDRLSGGQRTQVALALAAAAQPDVLVLDEPLSELDPVARTQVIGRLLQRVADCGTTLLLSTHVVTDLRGVADTLLVMAGGRLVLSGDIDDLLAQHHYVEGSLATPRVLVRQPRSAFDHPSWTAHPVSLEDLVLAYLQADTVSAEAS